MLGSHCLSKITNPRHISVANTYVVLCRRQLNQHIGYCQYDKNNYHFLFFPYQIIVIILQFVHKIFNEAIVLLMFR